MLFIKDKLLIFFISLSVYWLFTDLTSVVPILCVIILSGLNTYLGSLRCKLITMIIYICLCAFDINFIYFSPLIMYDIAESIEYPLLYSLTAICLISTLYLKVFTLSELAPIFVMYCTSIHLKKRSTALGRLYHLHYTSKNQLEDTASFLEQKNRALLEKQNSEIHIATLNERNRIAREIHDNVGHLLSRCLLQIGALMVIAKKDEVLYSGLGQVKDTLTQAMNSIRSSVHDLHDESLDLKLELKKIIGSFTFCHINFEYDLTTSPDNEIKYSFIAIVKEALANVMKHSHATEVEVVVHEHPAFYQLVIKDNDLSHSNMAHTNLSHSGIGLHNMNDRITRLDGQFSIDTTNGFKIFITVPKKKGNVQ